jgi:pyruvate dehydrogenase E2 component (dihydrolipoamide acetyltransferase)
MTIKVLMPAVGAGTSHGKIVQWLKKEGDRVAVGDILAEIETDKAVIELEAFDEGTLQNIVVDAGVEEVAVGEVIALLSSLSAKEPAQQETAKSVPEWKEATNSVPAQIGTALPNEPVRHFASPSARRLARQMDVEISTLHGSGPRGRVVRVDIENAAAAMRDRPAEATPFAPAGSAALAPTAQGRSSEADSSASSAPVQRIPHSAMRKTIARRLQQSKQQIPHFYLTLDCRMDAVLAMRAELNHNELGVDQPLKITINDILVYAVARAMAKVPDVNVRWTDEAIERNSTVDISVAVSTDSGLLTPIVKDAQRKTLGTISEDLSRLVHKARSGRLAPAEYEGGGLTVSNLGTHGIKAFSAIINPPQAAILAFGAVEKRPLVLDNALTIGSLMTMTLSADHRAIDGAVGARFMAELKASLEAPYRLLM